MLGLSFLFRFLTLTLILNLNNLYLLVCAVGDAILHHFCHLYQFCFLRSNKPWNTAGLKTLFNEHSLNPYATLRAFHQCQSETVYWGKLNQYSFSLPLSGISSHWVSVLFTGILCHVSLFCLSLCEQNFNTSLPKRTAPGTGDEKGMRPHLTHNLSKVTADIYEWTQY